MISRYINNSIYSVDNFFKNDRWLYRIKINDYQLVTIMWNLALMIVPWVAALALYRLWRTTNFRGALNKLIAALIFIIWLLFIPNTAYIMSEVRHLINYCPADSAFQVCEDNAWMSIFFFAYSLFGWVFFVYLLAQMRSLIELVSSRAVAWAFIVLIIPIISLGMLLGLLNRWNSWEFFIYPGQFFKTLPIYWQNPAYFTNWLIFTIFLYVLYWVGQWLFKDRFKL